MTDRPLNLLILNSGRRWIGEVAHCVLLAESLSALGHNVTLGVRRETDLARHCEARGLPHIALGFTSRFSPASESRDLIDLRALVRREGIDVIHAHRGKDHWIGAALGSVTGLPLMRTRHVVTPVKPHAANRWLYRKATRHLVSVSRAAEASLGPLLQLVREHEVILSAVDSVRFSPDRRQEPRDADAASEDVIRIGQIGRFQAVKGYKYMIAAAEIVARAEPRARFVIAGRNSDRAERYMRAAREAGFADRLAVHDHVEDLPSLMASLDIGVVASVGSEGSSRVCLEYMASGAAVVATSVGGIPDLLDADGEKLGELVPPRDADALAAAILRLVKDRDLRRTRAERAREIARTRHDPAAWARRFERIYRSLIGDAK